MSSVNGKLTNERKARLTDHVGHRFKKSLYPSGHSAVDSLTVPNTALGEQRSIPSWDRTQSDKLTF